MRMSWKTKRNILQVSGIVLAILLLIVILVLAMKLDAWRKGEEPWPDGHWYEESSVAVEDSIKIESSIVEENMQDSSEEQQTEDITYEDEAEKFGDNSETSEFNRVEPDVNSVTIEDSIGVPEESSYVDESESEKVEESSLPEDWGIIDWDEE